MQELDGSVLEGGGQVLRNAIALSTLLGTPVSIKNIRAGRAKPGLHHQHLTGLQLVAQLCDATVTGDTIGSSSVSFSPGTLKHGRYEADTKTAGSICLLIQIALPCLLFSPSPASVVVLRGGTNCDMAPHIDYLKLVFMPIAHKHLGLDVEYNVVRRGYYPKGRGEVVMTAKPIESIPAFHMVDKGTVVSVRTWSYVAGEVSRKVAERTASAAIAILKKHFDDAVLLAPEIVVEKPDKAFGSGSGIVITMTTSTGCIFAGTACGAKGKHAELVGREAADFLVENHKHGGCVDEYLQDQLIVFMALAQGRSQVLSGPISLHTETAIHFAERLTPAKFTVAKYNEADPADHRMLITCDGMAYKSSSASASTSSTSATKRALPDDIGGDATVVADESSSSSSAR